MEFFENVKFGSKKSPFYLGNIRSILWLSAIVIGVIIYTYIINYVPTGKSVFQINWIKHTKLDFYSGTEGGFYIEVGRLLDKKSKLRRYDVKIKNHTTNGGADNLRQVMTKKGALGIVQSNDLNSILKEYNFFKEVTPLYVEKVHILYNKKLYDSILAIPPDSVCIPLIKDNIDENFVKFMTAKPVIAPPVGSSSYLLAELIVDEMNANREPDDRISLNYELNSDSFRDRLEKLVDDKYGMLFFSAGAPLSKVKELIRTKKIGLVSISPSFISRIEQKVDFQVIQSDFNKVYEGGKDVSTFGSYALLIASIETENADLLETLRILDENKTELMGNNIQNFQLDEIPFYNNFLSTHKKERMVKLKSIFIFVTSVSISSILVFLFFLVIISSYNKSKLIMALVEIDREIKYNQPSLVVDNKDIIKSNKTHNRINALYHGILKVDEINFDIKLAYDSGKLTDKSFASLIEHALRLRDEFTVLLEKYLLLLDDKNISDEIRKSIKKILKLGLISKDMYEKFKDVYQVSIKGN
ncbi:MAG: hypothetical protein MI922_30395 [Bacteroidales bacterium]|nr:hypothetical protein [Bacteroidales bacterium]